MIREMHFQVPLWIKWFAIRLEQFKTVNNFATQWFNWLRVSKSSVEKVLCSLPLYNLFVVWITLFLSNCDHVKYSFRPIKTFHDVTSIYLPKKMDLWCALLTDYTYIRLAVVLNLFFHRAALWSKCCKSHVPHARMSFTYYVINTNQPDL